MFRSYPKTSTLPMIMYLEQKHNRATSLLDWESGQYRNSLKVCKLTHMRSVLGISQKSCIGYNVTMLAYVDILFSLHGQYENN